MCVTISGIYMGADVLQGEFVPQKTGRPVLLVAAGIGERLYAGVG